MSLNENWTGNATTDDSTSLHYVESFVQTYYVPFITIIGSTGNIISVVVFSRKKLRKLSSSYYLVALGISDTVYLLIHYLLLLGDMLSSDQLNILCKLAIFSASVTSVLSAWFVVAFTIERFIVVLYPLKRQAMCTVGRAKTIIYSLFLAALIDCSPFLYFSVNFEGECYVGDGLKDKLMLFNYWDTLLAFVFPVIIIAVLNSLIGYAIWKETGVQRTMMQRRFRSTLQSEYTSKNKIAMTARDIEFNGHHSRQSMSGSTPKKITKMLLIVSIFFILLNFPDYYLRVQGFLLEQDEDRQNDLALWQSISHSLFLTNYGINFVLYCITGQNFREELFALIKRSLNQYAVG